MFVLSVLAYAFYKSINYQKRFEFDFTGYTITTIVIIVVALTTWETIVLIDFILKDVNATVVVDANAMTIIKGKQTVVYDFKSLTKIEHFGKRRGLDQSQPI